jgi:hypothetical protein
MQIIEDAEHKPRETEADAETQDGQSRDHARTIRREEGHETEQTEKAIVEEFIFHSIIPVITHGQRTPDGDYAEQDSRQRAATL